MVILTIYPHTSHRLQPLDVSVFSPFKRAYSNVLAEWMVRNVGKRFSIYEVAKATAKVYDVAFTQNNIKSGFRATGIWPFDRNIFTETDFLSSEPTNLPANEDLGATSMRCRGLVTLNNEKINCDESLSPKEWLRNSDSSNVEVTPEVQRNLNSSNAEVTPEVQRKFAYRNLLSSNVINVSEPETDLLLVEKEFQFTSTAGDNIGNVEDSCPSTSSKAAGKAPTNQSMIVTPEDVSPCPKARRAPSNRKRKNKGDTLILTSTPVKEKLRRRKVKPSRPRLKPKSSRKLTKKTRPKKTLNPVVDADSSSSCEEKTRKELIEIFNIHTSDEMDTESDAIIFHWDCVQV